MEFKTEQTEIITAKTLTDLTVEQPVEGEVILPEYMAEISRVLICSAEPMLIGKNTTPGGITVDGEVVVQILYSDADGALFGYSYQLPFTRTLELPETAATVDVSLAMSYWNYRPTAERRMDLRGAVAVTVSATETESRSLLSSAEGDGVVAKKAVLSYFQPVGHTEKTSLLEEQVSPDTDKGIDRLLCHRFSVSATEWRQVGEKLLVKGRAFLHLLYVKSGTDDIGGYDTELPFSQLIETGTVTEAEQVSLAATVRSCHIHLIKNEGANDTVKVEAMIGVTVDRVKPMEATVLTDAFSTRYETEVQTVSFSCPSEKAVICEDFTVKKSLSLDEDGPLALLDTRGEPSAVHIKSTEEGLLLSGTVAVKMLLQDADHTAICADRTVEYNRTIPWPDDASDRKVTALPHIRALTVNLRGNTADIQMDMTIDLTSVLWQSTDAVFAVTVDKESGKKPCRDYSLAVYYASAGESIWEIAKRYNAAPDSIKSACGLEESILTENRMLLIPCL